MKDHDLDKLGEMIAKEASHEEYPGLAIQLVQAEQLQGIRWQMVELVVELRNLNENIWAALSKR